MAARGRSPRALRNLKTWVQHNPLYHGLEIKEDEYSDGSLMDEVKGGQCLAVCGVTTVFSQAFSLRLE
jgi:hypothetical protein